MTNASNITNKIALVLGATGGIGGATARALQAHGWQVKALVRNVEKAKRTQTFARPIHWLQGDAQNVSDVLAAASGASILVHAVNPPGYRNWRAEALPMLANTIAVARATGARILFPGNIYNFDPAVGPLLCETTPQAPRTRKGQVRVEMEQMLELAAMGGVRSTILRAGDFFGPGGDSTWFAQGVAKGGRPAKVLYDPSRTTCGRARVGHAWAYLPDVAETFARLADQSAGLPAFQVLHFGGHWLDGAPTMAMAARDALGAPRRPIRRFPWALVWLGAPFVGFLREMLEMRYLWAVPLRLDNRRLVALLGEEPHTPLQQALEDTFQAMDTSLGKVM